MPQPGDVLHHELAARVGADRTDEPTFVAVKVEDERVSALIQALRQTHVNGGALLAAFEVQTTAREGAWYWRHERTGTRYDLSAFFESDALASAVPELRVAEGQGIGLSWEWSGPFTLDGELTQILVHGGAYERFKGPAREAKRLAMDFCDTVFQDRYLDVNHVFRTYRAWTPWFYDVAWDCTWLIVDDRLRRVWLLCITDTD